MNTFIKQTSVALGSIFLSVGIACASGGNTHWGYSGEGGPENWGHLSPEFEVCGKGKNQSPIDISSMIESELPPISFSYKSGSLDVINNGHSIMESFAPGNSITLDDHTYELKQIHWHTPSENHVNGQAFPMEAHLVHADKQGNLAVIGIMYTDGRENSSIANIWNNMPAKIDAVNKDDSITVNPEDMLPPNRDYYLFNGSLTTPPCSEGVRWMVMKNPIEASAEQIKQFHSIFQVDTNRPVQPIYARPVLQ